MANTLLIRSPFRGAHHGLGSSRVSRNIIPLAIGQGILGTLVGGRFLCMASRHACGTGFYTFIRDWWRVYQVQVAVFCQRTAMFFGGALRFPFRIVVPAPAMRKPTWGKRPPLEAECPKRRARSGRIRSSRISGNSIRAIAVNISFHDVAQASVERDLPCLIQASSAGARLS